LHLSSFLIGSTTIVGAILRTRTAVDVHFTPLQRGQRMGGLLARLLADLVSDHPEKGVAPAESVALQWPLGRDAENRRGHDGTV